MNGAPFIGDNGWVFARTYSPGHVTAFNTAARSIAWRSAVGYVGQPAYRQNVIYAQSGQTQQLQALDGLSGAVLWSWPAPGAFSPCSNVLVADTHVFTSTSAGTHAINLSTRQSDWSTTENGTLALSGGRTLLIISGCDTSPSTIHGFRVLPL